ncbi:MAG: tetratricopeptide repeat protein [Muribaculaceae bacterium]|nr:tetratricopeptide repeat protein [Muribaculaceae bacterium]
MKKLYKSSHIAAFIASLIFLVLLLPGCGTKKNTATSRNWQAFTTRYNVYYNGKEHYNEQIKEMEGKYEDDYSRFLLTHPAEARGDQKRPQPTGDFKRTIEKMQKAIQLHSIKKKPARKNGSPKEKAFRARDEFNPFLHNAWMMLGEGQYLDGDFLGAAATFFYISKHFTWLPDVVTEARIRNALAYLALDWNYEAENALHLVKPKDLTNNKLKNLYNRAMADYYIRTEKYSLAIPYLAQAAKGASGTQKNRLYFLLGQLYSHEGEKNKAYQAFKKAGSGNSIPYRAKFNARIKQSEVFAGKNVKKEVGSLLAMTHYARNKEFLDQIYYAVANLWLSRKDTVQAKKYYALAVEKSTRNGIDKALAQLALGNIYFEEGEYVKAQPCYSEAVPQLPDNYPDYKTLKRRSDVLDELALYAGNVQLQDSLLTLSKMTPEEQRKVCQRLVDELIEREKKEAEEAKREEYLAQQEGNSNINSNSNTTTPSMMNSDKSWYFYNTMTKNAGKTEFQRRWGARKLEDDWRRRNKSSFSFDDEAENSDDEDNPNNSDNPDNSDSSNNSDNDPDKPDPTDPHNVEYYLSQIPSTEEEIKNCNDVIQEGLYNEGVILKDKLEDFPAARKEFMRLDERYPDNIYRLDVYYNMYIMAVRQDNVAEAERWRSKIIAEFPDSPYGQAMLDPDYFENLRRMNSIQEEEYKKAYDAYLNDNNAAVHSITANMEERYPLSKILPKFVFIDALSYLTEKDNDQFKERLTELLRKWPATDMTDMAGGILSGLKAGRVPNSSQSNSRGMVWSMRLSNDSVPMAADGQPANFERDPDKPQYLVLVFPRDSVNANQLLYDVARFNFSSFVVRDFDLEPMSFGNVGLLIVKGFDNLRQLEHYRSVMEKSPFRIPDGVRPVMISKANFELLLREGRSFEEYFRFEEDDKYDAVEESVLEPEEENSSEEDDEAVTSDESEEMPPSEEDDEAATSEELEAEE